MAPAVAAAQFGQPQHLVHVQSGVSVAPSVTNQLMFQVSIG
jgi:hypothetical protein